MRRPPAAVRRVRAGDLSPRHSRRVRGDFRAVRGERVRRRPRPPGPRRGVRSRRGARIPRMPWQGAGENNRAQRNRESVFPPARPHSAGSGECGAECAGALPAPAVGGGEHSPIPPASPPTFPARWSRPRSAALSPPPFAPRFPLLFRAVVNQQFFNHCVSLFLRHLQRRFAFVGFRIDLRAVVNQH